MQVKQFTRLGNAALTAAAICLLFGGTPANAETKLRASGHFPAEHTASKAMAGINAELMKLTGGAVKIDYFPASQLGGSFEGIDQVRTDQVNIDLGGPEWFGGIVPELEVLNLPFLVSSDRQAYCMIDSRLGPYLERKMAAKGLIVLGWMSNGARHLTNNKRPTKTLEDVKGLKIRTPPSEVYLASFRALGANPTPLDIKELYQALQQGVVDGQENPYGNTLARKFYEVQKYLSNTGHFYSWGWLVMNKSAYDNLKPEYREALNTATRHAVAEQRVMAERENKSARDELVKRGMKYDELSASELSKFRVATKPVYEAARGKTGNEVVDLALETLKACN